jgi:hypothetical protein
MNDEGARQGAPDLQLSRREHASTPVERLAFFRAAVHLLERAGAELDHAGYRELARELRKLLACDEPPSLAEIDAVEARRALDESIVRREGRAFRCAGFR